MRTAGLFALAVFLPFTAYAALVNINTADMTTLEDLPGVGPSTAASIIANRPYASIEDISRADGIGAPGSSSYEKIKNLITVGDTGSSEPPPGSSSASSTPPDASSSATSTTTTALASSSGGPAEYLPVPVLRIVSSEDRTVSSGADAAFTATVYDGKGNKRDDALVTWSFGDGMRRTGTSVFHAYYDPGEYLAVVHASTPDGGNVANEIIVTVKDASIKIASVSPRGISLANNGSRTLDLSLWRLSMGGQEFKIPEDTQILAGHTILFPSQVIELPVADSAFLLYPSGEVAAEYPQTAVAQPSAPQTSFNTVQTVESAPSTNTSGAAHEVTTVSAPAAATELAAAGAALPPAPKTGGLLHSPWTLGLIGVIALAGGAFIFL
jgi:hypothetical protein